MDNSEIAQIFHNVAQLLELKEENVFKIRAYDRAAGNIEGLTNSLEEIFNKGGIGALEEIPGIGKNIANHIQEILKTGTFKEFEELKKSFPKDFLQLSELQGMGPKTAIKLYKELKIDSVDKLEKAAKEGKLRDLPGFGEKKEENILKGIDLHKRSQGRFLLDDATAHAEYIIEHLSKIKEITKILPCGSLRRGQETVGDLDILVVSDHPKKVMDAFVKLPMVERVLAHGETKSSVIMKNKMQADIRVVPKNSFGAAAHYFTGSKAHNIHIRQLAQKKGWKVSEYGIFDKDGKQIGGETEEDMFEKFDLQFIPPELREMRGEYEAAATNKIPQLIGPEDIKGDLQMHSTHSDGNNTIEEMAEHAKSLGYSYIAITDHSKTSRIANGIDEKQLLHELGQIDIINSKLKGIKVLKGIEVDILPDGSLDLKDDVLKQCDVVLAAVHSSFKMEKKKMTARIIKALKNRYVNILAHPTGRLINERDPYELDMEEVLKVSADTGTFIEINAHPKRLDLNDIHAKRAKELGILLAINTDAHSTSQLELMKYGVLTARRGWIEKKDVINSLSIDKLINKLYSKRQ